MFLLLAFVFGFSQAHAAAAPSPSVSATPRSIQSPAQNVKSKYGTTATTITADHQYLQKHPAPDYWALSPFYIGEQTDQSSALASVVMIVNAARAKTALSEELVTPDSFQRKVSDAEWSGSSMTIDQLGSLIEKALKAYGFQSTTAEVMHAQKSSSFRKVLHDTLIENEKSSADFIIADFSHGAFVGELENGHVAPVGAYDAETKRVLIMDPDRQWYEPYWVSEDTFADGMATADSSSGFIRGMIWVKIAK